MTIASDPPAVTTVALDRPIVVMGVSGCGKSTIAELLAAHYRCRYVDADDLHPLANRGKMAAGIPLGDEDRRPWLRLVGGELARIAHGGSAAVVACSALKRSYRDALREPAPEAFFAHLSGSAEVIRSRLAQRHHAYMPPSLLDSQLQTLQPLEADESGVTVDLALPPQELVRRIVDAVEREHVD